MIYTYFDKYLYSFISVFLFITVFCFLKPFVISIDSVCGFLAYKGTLLSHSFNVATEISTNNVNETDQLFVSWWSPGQWLYPAILNYLFGIKLGLASMIVTLLFTILGVIGYYRVFTFFKFSKKIVFLSLILISLSSSFYYSYIIYQGGEILAFGMFPWFLYYLLRMSKISLSSLLVILALFILCFVAKTTLLLYCLILLLYKVFQFYHDNRDKPKKNIVFQKSLWLIVLPVFVCILIQIFFISRGPHPTLVNRLNISKEDVLIPLSSPLSSIISIQQWIGRVENVFASAIATILYLFLVASIIFCGLKIYYHKKISTEYKYILLFLYAGLSVFFVLIYSLNTNIDYSSRHFKLLGFLFLPALLTILSDFLNPLFLKLTIGLFCIVSIADIVYLKNKWTKNKYITANFFYKNYDNLLKADSLDEISYRKLIAIDKSEAFKNNDKSIFYIEADLDVAIDISHQCIIQRPGEEMFLKVYYGKGPEIVFCVLKRSGFHVAEIKKKFPGYSNFQLLDETKRYNFFKAN